MDSTPAALLDAVASALSPPSDTINPVINQYTLRPGAAYLSPAYIVEAFPGLGPFGVPYWMQGVALQTCHTMALSAPEPYNKSTIFHATPTLYTAGQAPVGQAPTVGIYTGVEDACK